MKQIVTLAIKRRPLSMCEEGEQVEVGWLLFYAAGDIDR
jgi:hypothetical protein